MQVSACSQKSNSVKVKIKVFPGYTESIIISDEIWPKRKLDYEFRKQNGTFLLHIISDNTQNNIAVFTGYIIVHEDFLAMWNEFKIHQQNQLDF